MIYKNDKISNEMKILGKEFVKNNNNIKRKCKLLINNKKYDIYLNIMNMINMILIKIMI